MAYALTHHTDAGSGTTPAQTIAVSSFTPGTDSYIFVVAWGVNNNHTTAPAWSITDDTTGGPLDWTQLDTSDSVSGGPFRFDGVIWRTTDKVASPESMTVTVDKFSGGSQLWFGRVSVSSATGLDSAGPTVNVATDRSGSGSVTVTRTAPSGPTLAWWGNFSDIAAACTWSAADTDYTRVSQGNAAGEVCHYDSWESSDSTAGSVDQSWTSSGAEVATAGFSVELVEDTGTAHNETITGSVGSTDAVDQAAVSSRDSTDAAAITSTAGQTAASSRAATDPVGLVDTIEQPVGHGRTVADSVGATDSLVQAEADTATATDPASLSDAAAAAVTYVRTVADSIGVIDDAQAGGDATDIVTDAVGLNDSVDIQVSYERDQIDIAGLTSSPTTALDQTRVVNDSTILTDQSAQSATLDRSLVDSLGLVDQTSSQIDGAGEATVGDLVDLADDVTQSATVDRSAPTEEVGVTDTVDALLGQDRTDTDIAGISDSLTIVVAYGTELGESIGIDGTPSTAATFARLASSQVGVTDSRSIIFTPQGQVDAVLFRSTVKAAARMSSTAEPAATIRSLTEVVP